MTSKELLKEIESWLSFNTEPSKEETAKLRKSIKDHLTEQLRIHDVMRSDSRWVCQRCGELVDGRNVTFEEYHEGCGGRCV